MVSKLTKVAPRALEWDLLVLVASLSSWDKARCTCLSILAMSYFRKKKKFLALGGAPLLCTYSSHDVPIECSCLNPKSACLGVPSFVTMALPPMVCGPAFVYPIPVMRPGLYLQHA